MPVSSNLSIKLDCILELNTTVSVLFVQNSLMKTLLKLSIINWRYFLFFRPFLWALSQFTLVKKVKCLHSKVKCLLYSTNVC